MTALASTDRDSLRLAVAQVIKRDTEIGAYEVQRRLQWVEWLCPGLAHSADLRMVGDALRKLGWVRDGFTGIGYDREPRFVAPRAP